MHKLAQSVQGYIRKHNLVRAGDRIGVAVSGGADSVALLRILLELRAELGLVLSVVHLNHKLRGAESNADERFVRDLAARHGLESFFESRNVKAHAREAKLSLEAAARRVRYEFFDELLHRGQLNKIATAHTLDDQAETVILKLVRGAGTRGLAGIYPKISAQHSAVSIQPYNAIVRPLLATRRKQIETYLREVKQTWREDSTNRDLRHTRNRVREVILPKLEEHVNPGVHEALAEAAEIARAEEEFWAGQVGHWFPKVSAKMAGGGIVLNKGLADLELALQRRLLRAAAASIQLHLEFHQVDNLLAFPEGGPVALGKGWLAVRQNGQIRIQRAVSQPLEYEKQLLVPGRTEVPECGVTLETSVMLKPNSLEPAGTHDLLDSEFARRSLVVRNWRPGDHFWPPHTKQARKIKDLLQDRHITGDEKKCWPVVASGDEVVWLRGFGVRRDCQSKNGKGLLIREVSSE